MSCCICFEMLLLGKSQDVAATKCGHMFHEECLVRWMDTTSSTCPNCREPVKRKHIRRIYFNFEEDLTVDEEAAKRIERLQAQLRKKKQAESTMREILDSYIEQLAASESLCDKLLQQLTSSEEESSFPSDRMEDQSRIFHPMSLGNSTGVWHITPKRENKNFADISHKKQNKRKRII